MHHITRCPNCRTSFRVTDAHLSAFEGKVRCGRCAFVFDALQHLQGESVPAATVGTTGIAASQPTASITVASPRIKHDRQSEEGLDQIARDEDAAYGLESMASHLEAAAEAERDNADESFARQSLQQLASALATTDLNDVIQPSNSNMMELDLETDSLHGELEVEPSPPPLPTAPVFVAHRFDDLPAPPEFEINDSLMDAGQDDDMPNAPTLGGIEVIEIEPSEAEASFSSEQFETWADAIAPAAPNTNVGSIVADTIGPTTDALAALPSQPAANTYRPILTAEDEALLRVPGGKSPWRWLWSIPALLALIGLIGQLTYQYRTELAIQLPGMEPRLQRFCQLMDCKIALPARTEYLRTEWNELVSMPERPNIIQLNATMRNQAPFSQAMPLLELTLTDDADRVVAKKVFSPHEYLSPLADGTPAPLPKSLGPNGEIRVFLQLDLGTLHSSGFSLNWFYPQVI